MLTNDIPLAGSVLIQGGTRVVAKPSGTGIRRKRQLAPHNVLRQRVYSAIAEPATLPFQKDAEHLTAWTPKSWQQFKAHQQPDYSHDENRLTDALKTISRYPALVFAGECRTLQARLAKCATGEAFLVQGNFLPSRMPCYLLRHIWSLKMLLD